MLPHKATGQVKGTEMILINRGNNNNSQLRNTGQLLMWCRDLEVTITVKVKGQTEDALLWFYPLTPNKNDLQFHFKDAEY